MTANNPHLIGEWRFIKAERHNGADWEPMSHTDTMTWQFQPEYTTPNETVGTIIERAAGVEPMSLKYIYNESKGLLQIEVYTDPSSKEDDEIDIYKVTTTEPHTIIAELINQEGCPPPYLRYTLQR